MATVCFSLTAHERIDVLHGQVLNIKEFSPGATIVIHLSRSFVEGFTHDRDRRILHMITNIPDVIINPTSLHTKWGHIIHAHISNIDLAFANNLSFDFIVLLSSGDLIFRRGISEYLSSFDMAVGLSPMSQNWGGGIFAGRVLTDPDAKKILQLSGSAEFIHSLHEGMAVRREIAWDVKRQFDASYIEWSRDAGYPREEIIFSTILSQYKSARITRTMSFLLGASVVEAKTHRAFVAEIFDCFRNIYPNERFDPILELWLDENRRNIVDKGKIFIASRVPRDPDNIIRRILTQNKSSNADSRSAPGLGENFIRLLDLDLPGRTNNSNSEKSLSRVVGAMLLSRRAGNDLLSRVDLIRTTVILDPCIGGGPELRNIFRWNNSCEADWKRLKTPFFASFGIVDQISLSIEQQDGIALNNINDEGTVLKSSELVILCIPMIVPSANFQGFVIQFAGTSSKRLTSFIRSIDAWIDCYTDLRHRFKSSCYTIVSSEHSYTIFLKFDYVLVDYSSSTLFICIPLQFMPIKVVSIKACTYDYSSYLP